MEIVEHPTKLTLDAIQSEARAAYAEAQALAIDARRNARAAVLRMADCGQMLLLGREHVRGNRAQWVLSMGIPLTDADKAVALARNRDQLNLELWPQDVAKMGAQLIGLLPPAGSANRAQDDPERTTAKSGHWLGYVKKLSSTFDHLFTVNPLSDWRDDERQSVKDALKPLVDIYAKL